MVEENSAEREKSRFGMESRASLYCLLVLSFVIAWLIWDLFTPLEIDYKRNKFLIDWKTGKKLRPIDVIDFSNSLTPTDDYINSTSSVDRLRDLASQIHIQLALPLDQEYEDGEMLRAIGLPDANATKCGQELDWILANLEANAPHQLMKGQHGRELTQLIDSMGKPEAGLFGGLITWVGSYDECRRLILHRDAEAIKTNYCWSKMKLKWWPEDPPEHPKTVIRVGTCLPASCDTLSFEQHKENMMRLLKFDWSDFYSQNLQIVSMECLPNEQSPVRQISSAGLVYLYALGGWICLVLVVSSIEEIRRVRQRRRVRGWRAQIDLGQLMKTEETFTTNGTRQQELKDQLQLQGHGIETTTPVEVIEDCRWHFELMQALSLRRAIKLLKTDRYFVAYKHNEHRPRVDLNWLNFVKLVMCICVILGHTAFLAHNYTRSISNRNLLGTREAGRIMISFGRLVDTFFCLFGIFGTYIMMSKFKPDQLGTPLVWVFFYIKVLARIMPTYLVLYCFARLIGPHIGSGPWWDYGTHKDTLRSICQQEPWWYVIPILTTFDETSSSTCIPPSWFLTVCLQLALVMPMVIYILIKMPNEWYRVAFVSAIALMSNAQMASRLLRQESLSGEAFALYGGILVSMIEKFQRIGTMSTFGHFGMIVESCYFGYLLRMFRVGQISEWPSCIKSRASLYLVIFLHLVIFILPLLGFALTDRLDIVPSIESVSLCNYLMSIIWPLINCTLIIQSATIYNHTSFIRFISHPFWTRLSELRLCAYLIHWEVIVYSITASDSGPTYGHKLDITRHATFAIVITSLISLFVYLFIESPTTSLLMLISEKIDKYSGKKKAKIICREV